MFDWYFYQDDKLIEDYKDKKTDGFIYIIDDNLHFDSKEKKLYRSSNDIDVVIDINSGKMIVNYVENNYKGVLPLVRYSFEEADNTITIIYQVDHEEPINRIKIRRK